MKILALDDEKKGLSVLTDAIKKVSPEALIFAYNDYQEAIKFVETTSSSK